MRRNLLKEPRSIMTTKDKLRFFCFAGSLVLSAAAAQAADLPGKGPPPAPSAPKPVVSYAPDFDFSGFYTGGAIGAHTLEQTFQSATIGLSKSKIAPDVSIYGGYNYGFLKNAFVGGEVDMGFSDPKATMQMPANTGGYAQESLNGSLRARLGYNVYGPVAAYALGGVAMTQIDTKIPTLDISNDSTKAGWIYGGGLEMFAMKNITIRGEYTVSQFAGSALTPTMKTPSFFDQMLKFGVSYKWD